MADESNDKLGWTPPFVGGIDTSISRDLLEMKTDNAVPDFLRDINKPGIEAPKPVDKLKQLSGEAGKFGFKESKEGDEVVWQNGKLQLRMRSDGSYRVFNAGDFVTDENGKVLTDAMSYVGSMKKTLGDRLVLLSSKEGLVEQNAIGIDSKWFGMASKYVLVLTYITGTNTGSGGFNTGRWSMVPVGSVNENENGDKLFEGVKVSKVKGIMA